MYFRPTPARLPLRTQFRPPGALDFGDLGKARLLDFGQLGKARLLDFGNTIPPGMTEEEFLAAAAERASFENTTRLAVILMALGLVWWLARG